MALVLNASDLSKKVTGNIENIDPNHEENNCFLIITKGDDIMNNGQFHADIVLQNDYDSFRLHFNVYDLCLQVSIGLSANEFNLNTITLYYINSQRKFHFMETLDVSNFTSHSTYSFARKFKFFYPTGLDEDHFVDRHLCIYCQVTTKALFPIKLKIPNKEMPVNFLSLYEDKFLTDYTIVCKGRVFHVHRLVLAARSTVFKNIIDGQIENQEEPEIKIKNFDFETTEHMLHYIYTDEIKMNITPNILEKLLMIAEHYELEKLKLLCVNELSKNLQSISEVLEVFSIANTYNVGDFKEAVLQFLKRNRHTL